MTYKKQIKHPCQGCVYFSECGENTRTMPCEGRTTKSERKAAEKAEQERKYKSKKEDN